MWKIDSEMACTFRHKHSNHFPPSPGSNDYVREPSWSYKNQYALSPSEDEEIPIVFRRPSETEQEHERQSALIMSPSRLPASPQPTLVPPPQVSLPAPPSAVPPPVPTPPPLDISVARHRPTPFSPPTRSKTRPFLMQPHLSPEQYDEQQHYHEPPTPSSQVPQNVTTLLTDVLSIMNSIMSQQALVASENELLEDLTELVVILQEEAEEMLMLADLVEEYKEELETGEDVVGLEAWAEDMGIGMGTEELDGEVERYSGLGNERNGSEHYQSVDAYEKKRDSSRQIERSRERDMNAEFGHERDESFDSGVGMVTRDEVRGSDGHTGELRLSLCKPREAERRSQESKHRSSKSKRKPKEVSSHAKEGKSRSKGNDNQPREISDGRKHSRKDSSQSHSRNLVKVHDRNKSMSQDLVRANEGAVADLRKLKSRKETLPVSRFRDSGLDIGSPRPIERRSSRKARWI